MNTLPLMDTINNTVVSIATANAINSIFVSLLIFTTMAMVALTILVMATGRTVAELMSGFSGEKNIKKNVPTKSNKANNSSWTNGKLLRNTIKTKPMIKSDKYYIITNRSHKHIKFELDAETIEVEQGQSTSFKSKDVRILFSSAVKDLNRIKEFICDEVVVTVTEQKLATESSLLSVIINIDTDKYWNTTLQYDNCVGDSLMSMVLFKGGMSTLLERTSGVSHILTPKGEKIDFRKNECGKTSDGHSYIVMHNSVQNVTVSIVNEKLNKSEVSCDISV